MSRLTPTSQERTKAEWTPSRDVYFVELLIEQQNIGRKSEGGFSIDAWRSVASDFNRKFGLQFDVVQLKNRSAFLRRQYNTVKTLLDQSGFSWDEVQKTVTAADDVWDRHLLEHPKVKSYRTKALPLYDQLCIIYGGASVEGKDQLSSIRSEAPIGDVGNTGTLQSPVFSSTALPTLEAVLEEFESCSKKEIHVKDSQHKRRSVMPTTSRHEKRVQKSTGNRIVNALQEIALSSKLRAEQSLRSKERFSYGKCLEELQQIEDLDNTEFVKAVNILKDGKNAIAFMSLRGHRRLAWLKSMCCTE